MSEEKISFQREDVTLNGMLFIPNRGNVHPMVIVAHGLPSTALPVEEKGYDELGRQFCSLGIACTIFNFSGCKGSGGFFSLKNWMKDLETVSNSIRVLEEVDPSRVAYLAFSMGTIPTIYFIAHLPKESRIYPSALVICACPAALSKKRLTELQVGIHLTAETGGIRIMNTYDSEIITEFKEYMPIKWIRAIPLPKFILHGAQDELINVQNAKKLYEAAVAPKKLYILEKAGHKLRQDGNAMKKIFEILERSLF